MKPIMISLSKLSLTQARKYAKGWDKGRYAEAFTENGKARYRMYIELAARETNHVQAPEEVEETLEQLGYTVEDYISGIAVDSSGKRRMRIGRLLAKHPEVKKLFERDPVRKGQQQKFMICISRHPYDIAGMSTDRGWTSCMNLANGCNKEYVKKEIEVGTIIAYLIKPGDTNLKSPSARVLLKPFYEVDIKTGKQKRSKPILVCDGVYGSAPDHFLETVQRWADVHINRHSTNGIFKLNSKSYGDEISTTVHINGEDGLPSLAKKLTPAIRKGKVRAISFTERRHRDSIFSDKPELLNHTSITYAADLTSLQGREFDMIVLNFLLRDDTRVFDTEGEELSKSMEGRGAYKSVIGSRYFQLFFNDDCREKMFEKKLPIMRLVCDALATGAKNMHHSMRDTLNGLDDSYFDDYCRDRLIASDMFKVHDYAVRRFSSSLTGSIEENLAKAPSLLFKLANPTYANVLEAAKSPNFISAVSINSPLDDVPHALANDIVQAVAEITEAGDKHRYVYKAWDALEIKVNSDYRSKFNNQCALLMVKALRADYTVEELRERTVGHVNLNAIIESFDFEEQCEFIANNIPELQYLYVLINNRDNYSHIPYGVLTALLEANPNQLAELDRRSAKSFFTTHADEFVPLFMRTLEHMDAPSIQQLSENIFVVAEFSKEGTQKLLSLMDDTVMQKTLVHVLKWDYYESGAPELIREMLSRIDKETLVKLLDNSSFRNGDSYVLVLEMHEAAHAGNIGVFNNAYSDYSY